MATATDEVPDVAAAFARHLSNGIRLIPDDRGRFLATPYIRPDGEAIELELECLADGRTRLHDMGNSLAYLWLNGVISDTGPTPGIDLIARQFGVAIVDNALQVEADDASLGERACALLEAARAVSWLGQSP